MKIFNKLIIGIPLVLAAQLLIADNMLDEMMKKGAEQLEVGKEATKAAMDKAMKKAADDAESAKMKLTSFSIDYLKDDKKEETDADSMTMMFNLMNSTFDINDEASQQMMDEAMKMAEKGKAMDFPWTRYSIAYVNSGDPVVGAKTHKELKCYKCHGDEGISDEDDTPSVAGQISAYTFKQLYDYKVGIRSDSGMRKKVKKMTAKQMADVSAYYATLKREEKVKSDTIPHLAKNGDKSRFLFACEKCHNEKAMKRGLQTPIIEGQKVEYFTDTLTMFKEAERSNDHYSIMRKIAAKLTDEEIEALSEYYSAKPADDDE